MEDNFTKAQAALKIRELVAIKNKKRREMSDEPITSAQKWYLNNAGINTDDMSKLTALREISKLKQKTAEAVSYQF